MLRRRQRTGPCACSDARPACRTRAVRGPASSGRRRERDEQLAVQWHRNASTVQTWKISWNPNRPGRGWAA